MRGLIHLSHYRILLTFRVRWGLKRVAIVDIDVHFGNGTSEILKGDPRAFFGCVHMIHGDSNEGFPDSLPRCCIGTPKDILPNDRFHHGFFPHALGCTQVADNYISVGVYPEHIITDSTSRRGPSGFRSALSDVIIPSMERFDPELLIISGLVNILITFIPFTAGFDGNKTDPLGGDLGLSATDYNWATHSVLISFSKLIYIF
jgi:acetoin utilization deacetylase AcuC-like enzyme